MKKLSFLILLILVAGSLRSQEQLGRRIEVFGTSTIQVKPDMLNWNVTIQYESNNVSEIKSNIDRSTEEVLELLRRAGVKPEDIQTSGIMVYKNYIDPNNPAGVKKYNGTNTVRFILRDISLYDDIAEGMFEIENVFTSSPGFDYSKAIETREMARENALLAARKKADAMARTMGVTLGRIMVIEEQPQDYVYNTNNVMYRESLNSTDQSGFMEGQINIEARVRVIFEII